MPRTSWVQGGQALALTGLLLASTPGFDGPAGAVPAPGDKNDGGAERKAPAGPDIRPDASPDPKPKADPNPDIKPKADPVPEEARRVTAAFRLAAQRSLGPRSGDLFVLPSKYHYIIDGSYIREEHSALPDGEASRAITHEGNHHGTFWDYDTRIPLVLWGPGRVRVGWRSREAATQQDIVPTLAQLIGAVAPEDATGRVLKGALLPAATPPKVVLVLVFDQGGRSMLQAHPEAWPFIRRLRAEGSSFDEARVSHLDPETVVGHVAIGTGAWPARHGIAANTPHLRAMGVTRTAILGPNGPEPMLLDSPSLADVWLRESQGRAVVIAQSMADRAAIGMVGHGAQYAGNPKPICQWYDERRGLWTTLPEVYRRPDYLADLRAPLRWPATGDWRGHLVQTPVALRMSPGAAAFDGLAMREMVAREPLGEDEVPDLIFWSIKATDYVAHRYGLESLETRDALRAADEEARKTVEALVQRVGRENLLIVFTADHGGGPLPERYGGARLSCEGVAAWINQRFDRRQNDRPVALAVTSNQVFLDDGECAAQGVTPDQVAEALKAWKPFGKPFFEAVLTRAEVEATR